MEKDENKQEGDLENTSSEATESAQKEAPKEEDYRGKLNATNRFLEREGYQFVDGKWTKPEVVKETADAMGLSMKDTMAVLNAKVPEEDLDEVRDYAALKKISISDALKSPVVQGILTHNAETRRTQQAAQTGSTRTISKPTGNEIVADINARGEDAVPAGGSEEAEELFWQRRGGRRDK